MYVLGGMLSVGWTTLYIYAPINYTYTYIYTIIDRAPSIIDRAMVVLIVEESMMVVLIVEESMHNTNAGRS